MRLFRWKALLPLAVFAVVVVLLWVLFVDRLIKLGIEVGGTAVNGAKVELASARLRLFQGDLRLRGLQVTDAHQPMRNLFAVDEIKLDLGLRALLQKKFDAETVAVRGLTFGGARKTSGALPQRAKAPGKDAQDSTRSWASKLPIPKLDLGSLGKALDIKGLSTDSLRSLREARALAASGDSLKTALEGRVAAADPRPTIDSAEALAKRLSGTNLRTLGLSGARDAAGAIRNQLNAIKAARDRLTALQRDVTAQAGTLRSRAAALDQARAADYAYARRLVNVPSLDPKDLAMSLLGRSALEHLVPQLAYLRLLDRIPPGMKPQLQAGPRRARMAGTTFVFPKAHRYPTLLLEFAEGTFTLPGRTTAAGQYVARLTGVTTEPAVYGKPLTFLADRAGAVAVGPQRVHVAGAIDRTGDVPRDSVVADLGGVDLPSLDLAVAGARVDLRTGDQTFAFTRYGDTVSGAWHVRADSVSWSRRADNAAARPSGAAPSIGSQAWLDGLVWGAVTSLRNVEFDARIHGRLTSPSFDLSSNIGGAVSRALGQAVAAEARKAETMVRSKVDSLVGQPVAAARGKIGALDAGPLKSITDGQGRLDTAQRDLEAKLRGLTPGGIRLP